MKGAAQAVAGSGAQGAVEVANDIFKALGIQICIIHPSSSNARVRVATSEKRGPKEHGSEGSDSGDRVVALTPQQFVQFMREASGSLRGCGLRDYVAHLSAEGQLEWVPGLPESVSSKLYLDIARLIVFSFQRALMTLDQAQVWGHTLRVSMATPVARFDSMRLKSRKSVVGLAQLDAIVTTMMEDRAVHMPLVPAMIQRRLYRNCMTVVFLLLEDLLTGQNEGVSFMGHKLRFNLRAQPVDQLLKILEFHPVNHCRINDVVLNELVNELLNDAETNIKWIPDAVESQIYTSALRCVIRIAERIVCRLQLNILGREVNMSILSHIDVQHMKQRKKAAEGEFEMYYGEENPMQSATTTELEERLEDIYAQRRILEALQELGSASFDLTQDTPMQNEGSSRRSEKVGGKTSERDGSTRESAAEGSAVGGEEAQLHEFQRLAHTLKLARSLSQTFDVDADIEVPYHMIADLESYSQWMPWCTSGLVVPNGPDTPAATDGEEYIHGQVGFGFETGTFLGTLGDTVFYRVKVKPPPSRSEAPDRGDTTDGDRSVGDRPIVCAVCADAVNGFTYGKRLVYDWRFTSIGPGKTRVELDMLFQAHNVLYMPIWDSMQNMVINNMLHAFRDRAEKIQKGG